MNDRRWEGATVEAIKRAVRPGDEVSVVFLADHMTMTSAEHTLLAVNLDDASNDLDEEHGAQNGSGFGRQFRIVPNEASGMAVDLGLGNRDYDGWAVAANSADGVLRGF